MAQAGFTPIQLYRTTTASAQPSAGNLAAGELAINLTDKKLYAKDASNNVFLLADASSGGTTAANLAGGAAGSLPYQSGANATTFLGIGAANRVLTSSGTAPQWVTSLTGLTGVSSSSVTNTSLTPTRLVYSTTGGAQTDSANLTFDGTSLTLGGNPTLSAGTANGVLYLNGSKVATSGSALTFDGSNLTSTVGPFRSTVSTVDSIFGSGSFVSGTLGIGTVSNHPITFNVNLNELMRLDSTGLGIGRTASTKLDVNGSAKIGTGAASNSQTLMVNNPSGTATQIQLFQDGVESWTMGMPASSAGLAWAASGSEQMRLTSTGLGIGTTPTAKLDVQGNAKVNGANARIDIIGTTQDWGLQVVDSDNRFRIINETSGSGSELVLTTSGNLGLGVTPSAKLDVAGAALAGGDATYRGDVVIRQVGSSVTSNGGLELKVDNAASGFGARIQSTFNGTSAYDLSFQLRNNSASWTQRMLLDSSGNLGLGITPSAWGLGKAFEIGIAGNCVWGVQNADLRLGANMRYDGSDYRYVNNGLAARYDVANATLGGHAWYTAPSGTAGNAISFTQAMTLDASGRFLVGTTTAGIGGSANTIFTAKGNADTYASIIASGNEELLLAAQSGITKVGAFSNHPLLFITNNTERARITDGGDLLVGGTSTSTIPTLNKGIYLQSANNNDVIGYSVRIDDGVNVRRGSMFLDDANGVFGWDVTASSGVPEYVWRTAGQERARITSGGAFLVGTTSTNGAFSLNTNTETWAAWLQQAHTTSGRSLVRLQYSVATPNVATDYFLYCDDATAVRANIRSNGGLANYQSNNVDLSDARTKKDITPAPSYWNKIGALEIVTYKYKDQTHDDINVGVIAQQVEQVEPVWVDTEGFGEVPEGEEPMKTVYTKDITFAAIKALQEAMFRIEALEAKVAALETH